MKRNVNNRVVFETTSRKLRKTLRSIAANVKSRKTLTGRQRRRAQAVVGELRLALDDAWSGIPLKRADRSWQVYEKATNYLLKEVESVTEDVGTSYGSKYWLAIGKNLRSNLEEVTDEWGSLECQRKAGYGLHWNTEEWAFTS